MCLAVLITSCNDVPEDTPFPELETEFQAPDETGFRPSEPEAIRWDTSGFRRAELDKGKTLDLGDDSHSIAYSGAFEHHGFAAYSSRLNFAGLPYSVLNLDRIPSRQLSFTVARIAPPQRIKTTPLRTGNGALCGVLQLGKDQGLPGAAIHCIGEDPHGFVWLGTDRGLCRLDGENIDVFSKEQGLPNNSILTMMWTRGGMLVIGTYGAGVTIYDPGQGSLKTLTTQEGLGCNTVLSLLEDKSGRLWIGTEGGGVDVLDIRKGVMSRLNRDHALCNDTVRALIEDSSGRIWIGTGRGGVNIFDPPRGILTLLDRAAGLSGNSIFCLLEDAAGRIWIGTDGNGVNAFDPGRGTLAHIGGRQGLRHGGTRSLIEGSDGCIWIGATSGGVHVWDPRTDRVRVLDVQAGIPDNLVLSLLQDKHRNIWIGTHNGAAILGVLGNAITRLNKSRGLSDDSIFGLLEDSEGRIWIGNAHAGVDVYRPEDGVITAISRKKGLVGDAVYALLEDRAGRVWIGSTTGITLYEPGGRRLRQLSLSEKGGRAVSSFLEDRDGNIWIGMQGHGIAVCGPDLGGLRFLDAGGGLSDNMVSSMIEDADGRVWIGTYGSGVDIIDRKSGTVRRFNVAHGSHSDFISCFARDELGRIWIGSYGDGVALVDMKRAVVFHAGVNHGLSDHTVTSIGLRNGDVFLGTGDGLVIVKQPKRDNDTWSIMNISTDHGLPYPDFNPAQPVLAKDGRLWWAVHEGVTILDDIDEEKAAPTAYISGIDVMEKPRRFVMEQSGPYADSSPDTEAGNRKPGYHQAESRENEGAREADPFQIPGHMTVSYDENHLTFHFTVSQLPGASSVRYRHILEGSESRWSSITEKEMADYRNLSPGIYVFKVSARGMNGRWSKPAVLRVTVAPPFWRTWWAYAIYALAFSFLVFSIDRTQRQRVRRREREAARMRIAEFRAEAAESQSRAMEAQARALAAENARKELELEKARELERAYTILKETQAQLIQQEKLASLGRLSAGIAHEIKNPLNFVNNFSALSLDMLDEIIASLSSTDYPDPASGMQELRAIAADLRENILRISAHGERADAIVEGMMTHARSRSEQRRVMEVEKLLELAIESASRSVAAKHPGPPVAIERHFGDIGEAELLPNAFKQAVLNLLDNAFHAVCEKAGRSAILRTGGPAGERPAAENPIPVNWQEDGPFDPETGSSGEIPGASGTDAYAPLVRISTRLQEGSIEIDIEDNGSGISEDVAKRMFEPFFTTKPTGEGTGLGLSISHDIIAQGHGGTLEFSNSGGMTRFRAVIPVRNGNLQSGDG